MTSETSHPISAAVELVKRTVSDSIADRVPGLAAEVAVLVVLALPPRLLVVLGLAAYVAAAKKLSKGN